MSNFNSAVRQTFGEAQVGVVGSFGGNRNTGYGNDFKEGLKVGYPCIVTSDKVDNMKTSTTKDKIIGVVEYQVDFSIEGEGLVKGSNNDANVTVMREGIIAMKIKSGQTPTIGGKAYANTQSATLGQLQTSSTNGVEIGNGGALFEVELASDIWAVRIKV